MTKTLMISMAARPGAKLKLAITVRVSPRYVPLDVSWQHPRGSWQESNAWSKFYHDQAGTEGE